MSETQEKLLRQYCAHVLVKYGFEFSPHDPVVPALYTIYKELSANKTGNDLVAKSIKNALEQLNPTVYNFNERGEAWKFKMAESIRWLFAGSCLVAVVGLGLVWWRQHNNVQRASEIITTYSGAQRILTLAAKKDSQGFMYLDFSKSNGNYVAYWTEYYEVKKDTVRVYLGKPD
jgi:hypothetical protein